MTKTAIITGITGQDGAYLAQYLLEQNYKVIGTYRHSSCPSYWRIIDLDIEKHPNLTLYEYDLTDSSSIIALLEKFEPDEFYNLAAQSFVGASFTQPFTTTQITGTSVLSILEGIRTVNKKIKFYQASSSEMFGKVQAVPQNEKTSFYPRSPYAVAKLYAHWITINYRESYDLFNCSGILFNHESPLRGAEFVTRKITDAVAKIVLGKQDCLELGNLDAKRDWGFAGDYVKGMHAMLQHDTADDYVLATGITQSVRDFVNMSFHAVDINLEWKGHDLDEIAINPKNGKTVVQINPTFQRPAEVDLLLGDPSKAKEKLGWEAKTDLKMLCNMMIQADLTRNK